MARAAQFSESPFSDINVTPFIDILLVLMIMLILTIPIANHKLPVDLPQPSPIPATPAPPHVLAIDSAGALRWDGRAIADAQLPALLAATAKADAPLAIDADGEARYERFNQILNTVRRSGVTRLGFMGRHRLQD